MIGLGVNFKNGTLNFKKEILVLLIVVLPVALFGVTYTSTTSGIWSSSSTWGGSGTPSSGDTIIIKNGAIVTVDVSNAQCSEIYLGSSSNPNKGDGTLSFNSGSQLTSTGTVNFGEGGNSGYVNMTSGGTFITNVWNGKKGGLTSGTGTIRYTGTFTLASSAAFDQFYNLEITGTVTMATGIQIDNSLTLTSGSFDVGGKDITMLGNWINNGGDFVEGTGNELVVFQGTSSQDIKGETFNRIEIDNANGVTLSGDVTLNDRITFTNGDITLGTSNLIFENAASAANQSDASHVVTNSTGELRMKWTDFTGKSFAFPVGDGTNYTPFSLTMNNSAPAGANPYISVSVTDGAEPNHSEIDYLTRYWDVSASDLTVLNYNWSANYIQADVVGVESSIWAAKYNGTWIEFNQADSVNNVISGNNGSEFSSFTGKTSLVTLPVELVRFEGEMQDGVVQLNWETSSEINNDYFVVEKSLDGVSFTEVDRVDGMGNSIVSNQYFFTEFSDDEMFFYRLKQVDFDGAYEYSNIIKIGDSNEQDNLVVFPNPLTKGQFMTIYFKQASEVRLLDSNGSIVSQKSVSFSNSVSFSTSNLVPGNYIAQVMSESEIQFSKFLVTP